MKPGIVALAIFTFAMLTGCGDAKSIDNVERAAENERRDDARDARAVGLQADRQAVDEAYARDQKAEAAAKVEASETAAAQAPERNE